MASVSVSSLVLFIAALTVAVGVATTMTTTVSDLSESLDDKGLAVSQEIDTDIEIISDAGSSAAVYDDSGTGTTTLLVKNVGRGTLSDSPSRLDILIDGQYVSSSNITVTVIDEAAWKPGAVAEITVTGTLGSGDHRAVVVVDGDEDTFEFYT